MRSFHLPRRRQRSNENEADPLGALRRRCIVGFVAGGGTYLTVIATTVVRPTALTLKQIIGLEFGLGIGTMACAVVSIVAWVLTQNTEHALQIWSTATRSRSLEVPPVQPIVPEARNGDAIPIGYGREVRAQRNRKAI